jgi:uncharacterized protein (DUF433 family)
MDHKNDLDWEGKINIDPAIMHGRPVIKGRRVPVEVIVGALAAGDTVQEVCEGYRLTEEDVRAALRYAAYVLSTDPVHALPS